MILNSRLRVALEGVRRPLRPRLSPDCLRAIQRTKKSALHGTHPLPLDLQTQTLLIGAYTAEPTAFSVHFLVAFDILLRPWHRLLRHASWGVNR